MSAADGAQGANPAGHPYPNLIKPAQVESLPFFQEATSKQKMFSAVSQYWSIINSTSPESPQHKAAHEQLTKISNTVRTKYAQWKEQNSQAAGAQRPQSQGQPQTQPAQQQTAQGGEQAQPTQNTAPTGQPQPQIPPGIMKHISEFQFCNPREKPRGTPEGEKWFKAARDHYAAVLVRMEKYKNNLAQLDKIIEQHRQRNSQPPQEYIDKRASIQKDWEAAKTEVTNFRKAQMALQQQQQQQQQQNAQQAQQTNVQVKTEAGTTQPTGVAASFNMQASAQQNGQQPAQRLPANAAANPVMTNAQNQNRASVSSASGSQIPTTQGFAQPQGPIQQQGLQSAGPTRPPLNTQIPPQTGQTPQSANQMNQNGPRTLSQKEAIAQAQRSYSERQTPQSAVGQVGSRELPTSGSKFPIPKVLPERATSIPTPVAMSATRPTLSGPANGLGGMMGQVPIEKQPGTVMLEGGEGGVLSRKKLHELVREVGGPDESLTPEVEDVS